MFKFWRTIFYDIPQKRLLLFCSYGANYIIGHFFLQMLNPYGIFQRGSC